jgi:signal transduction histidine kinase
MRIAMDLHDEVGSGLGSIGVLSGILARPDLSAPQRADLSSRIGAVARELSQSLGDIVWSLRAGSGHLDSMWAKILDRASPLFASGSPRLLVESPDPVPGDPLSLAVRRNASLVAIEALHNAARHSGASVVRLALAREREAWRIEIADDGRGLDTTPTEDATRRGMGLEAMRSRAAEMGGSIEWERPAAGGTRVVLRFRGGPG